MDVVSGLVSQTALGVGVSGGIGSTALMIFLVILILVGIAYCIYLAVVNSRIRSTPENIQRIKVQQQALCDSRWVGVTQSKEGLSEGFQGVPAEQQLLINANVLGVRLTSYLGPYDSGVFDEQLGVRYALASGARCIVLEVDRETNKYEPLLTYRDGWGIRRSLNQGSLEKTAQQIAGRAFSASSDGTPAKVADSPLILCLYIVSAPSMADTPQEYVRFLAKIAEQCQSLVPHLVGQTPQGDFRRQSQESQLFYQPVSVFARKIVMLCNADTTPFRRLDTLGLAGEIGPSADLDLMVHARLYSRESPSGLGITGGPTATQQPSAVVTTPNYWLQTPPDRLGDAISQTKKAWTLCMTPVASEGNVLDKEQLKRLLVTYGVQCVPLTLFAKEEQTDVWVGKDAHFQRKAWVAKPELIRFIPPAKIPILKPIPQTDAGGGAMRSPA